MHRVAAAFLIFSSAWAWAGGVLTFQTSDFSAGVLEDTESDFNQKLTLKNRWTQLGGSPAGRYYSAIAFSSTAQKAVLFGGSAAGAQALSDTWIWNAASSAWSQISASPSPSARYGHALSWAGGNKVLLFGGAGSDTWIFDFGSNQWTELSPSSSPPSDLFLPSMAYDPDRNRVVLFGGGAGNATWIFDVADSSWTSYQLSPSPSARVGAFMAYDELNQKFVLFGGKTGSGQTFFDETWIFDPAAIAWTQRSPSGSPLARAEGGAGYDALHQQIVIYAGRLSGLDSSAQSDMHYYHYGKNRWASNLSTNNDSPPARYGASVAYDTRNRQWLVFGGRLYESSLTEGFWSRVLRSTGSAVSAVKNISGITPVQWSSASAVFEARPEGSDALFQIASSTNGVLFDSYRGPDGSTASFYSSSHTPLSIWAGHQNSRFLKIRAEILSTDMPFRPRLSSLSFSYNQAPSTPVIVSPASGSRVNISTPVFAWQASVDGDGAAEEPFLYQLQVDTASNFLSPDISSESLSTLSFVPSSLNEGLWYWRLRAKDDSGFYGDWSQAYTFTIDTTTPPNPIAELSALSGSANGELRLQWKFAGDDKPTISSGSYHIRLSAAGPIGAEPAWQAAASSERSALFSATSAQVLVTTITALETGTSYYLAIKVRDEAGNLSPLSLSSPFAMTNASPTVTLQSHDNGAEVRGTSDIRWNVTDPNSGDFWTTTLKVSSQIIASGLFPEITSYAWDSRKIPNGFYRIQVMASDERGFSGADISQMDFRVDNANEAPQIQLTSAPSAGQEILGTFLLAWNATDANSFQTLNYDVYISTDSGAQYQLLSQNLAASSVTLDTLGFFTWLGFPTASTYRFKVTAKDSGTPALSASVETPVFKAVVRQTHIFNLRKPLETDYPSVFDLSFSWDQPSGLGNTISYTLKYSTDPLFSAATTVASLSAVSYTPSVGTLGMDATYYWQVTAFGSQVNQEVPSTVEKFILESSRVKSVGGGVDVRILSGLPAGAYLNVRQAGASYQSLLDRASQFSKGDRLMQTISQPAWHIQLTDLSGNPIAGVPTARVTFQYSDQNKDGLLDSHLTPVDQLKIAKLNENEGRWELIQAAQSVDKNSRTLSVPVSGFSVFTVLAASAMSAKLGAVTNFPNPFEAGKESTRIRYVLTENASVSVRIYTLLGDLVKVFESAPGTPGGIGAINGVTNELIWDGKNGEGIFAANGMYIVQIRARFTSGAEESQIRRIGVVK